MNSMIETFPQLATYQPSLLALALLCMAVLIQSFLGAPLAFVRGEQVPGMPLKGDHNLLSFRVLRTHSNSVESLPALGLTVFLAIVVGVNPLLVNWLVAIHVAFRFAFWAVYYSGIGLAAGGPRTICYVGGLVANIALLASCIYLLVA